MEKTKAGSWLQPIAAWQESDLSKAEFCRQAGLHYQKFCYHYRRAEIVASAENAFVALRPSQLAIMPAQLSNALTCDNARNDFGRQSGIRLCLGSVGVERGFCSKTLLALLCLQVE